MSLSVWDYLLGKPQADNREFCQLRQWFWEQAVGYHVLSSETNSRLPPCLSLADDGKLSLEEFQLFFADGVLNEKELEGLFHTIDSDNTK